MRRVAMRPTHTPLRRLEWQYRAATHRARDRSGGSLQQFHPGRPGAGYGVIRSIIRANGIVSRTWCRPQIQATHRSTPMPKPACGTEP